MHRVGSRSPEEFDAKPRGTELLQRGNSLDPLDSLHQIRLLESGTRYAVSVDDSQAGMAGLVRKDASEHLRRNRVGRNGWGVGSGPSSPGKAGQSDSSHLREKKGRGLCLIPPGALS